MSVLHGPKSLQAPVIDLWGRLQNLETWAVSSAHVSKDYFRINAYKNNVHHQQFLQQRNWLSLLPTRRC